jgi:hypothetical protein
LDEELARLKEWHDFVFEHLPSDQDPEALANALRAMVSAARQLGVLGPPQLASSIDEEIRAFRRSRLSVVADVGALIDQARKWTQGRLLGELAEDRDRPMREIQQFVRDTDAIIRDTHARLGQQERTLAAAGGTEGMALLVGELAAAARVLENELEPTAASD